MVLSLRITGTSILKILIKTHTPSLIRTYNRKIYRIVSSCISVIIYKNPADSSCGISSKSLLDHFHFQLLRHAMAFFGELDREKSVLQVRFGFFLLDLFGQYDLSRKRAPE